MLDPKTIHYPIFFVENSTQTGFLAHDVSDGSAVLLFSSEALAEEYKKKVSYKGNRTIGIRNDIEFLFFLNLMPFAIVSVGFDVDVSNTVEGFYRIDELKAYIQERMG